MPNRTHCQRGAFVRAAGIVSIAAALLIGVVGCSANRHRPHQTVGADTSTFPALAIVSGEPSHAGVVITISDDIFADGIELKAGAERDLAALAGYLKQHPAQKLVIASPAAKTSDSANLARRRRTAVEAFFLKSGVDPERVKISATGSRGALARSRQATGDAPSTL